jgi:hypothetical protein
LRNEIVWFIRWDQWQFFGRNFSTSSHVGVRIKPSDDGTARAISIPELLAFSQDRISRLKVDIEGSEIDLVDGAFEPES